MDKIEIDKIVRSCIETNHRAIFVLKKQTLIPTLYDSLNEHTLGPRPQLVYLFKKKPEDVRLTVPNAIDYVKFDESDKILGSTISMLVIQDFDVLTPNLLAKSVETVKGGGLCCFIIDKIDNKLFNSRLLKCLSKSQNTFFCDQNDQLLLKKVKKSKEFLTSHSVEMNPICSSGEQINSIFSKESNLNNDLSVKKVIGDSKLFSNCQTQNNDSDHSCKRNIHAEIEENIKNALLSISKTRDQLISLKEYDKILTERSFKTICSLTAARGRGKSAVLGLTIALALHYSFTTINIAAPLLENVKTVFEFVILGLKALGYKEKVHFDVFFKSSNKNRLVWKIIFRKKFLKQQVSFLDPATPIEYLPDLMVVDEAAAVPLPTLQKLLASNLVIMASTVDGYEGTGRALVLKLFADLEKKSKNPQKPFLFHKQSLNIPIRYGSGDPVEKWLNKTLVLYAQPQRITELPAVTDCEIHVVNTAGLFSGSKTSELFLNQIMSVLTASHYKNTPNDLLRMSESLNSTVFVLCPKIITTNIPNVICVIEVVDEKIYDLKNKEGNLTQHCLFENYQIPDVMNLVGKRVLRIAVHPDLQRMGYGKQALKLLINHFSSQKEQHTTSSTANVSDLTQFDDKKYPSLSENTSIHTNKLTSSQNDQNDDHIAGSSHHPSVTSNSSNIRHNVDLETNIDRLSKSSLSAPLLRPLNTLCPGKCDYLSASFGVTSALLSFWKPLGFCPIHVKAHSSPITGDFSSLLVLPFTNHALIEEITRIFKTKFILNCASFYSKMPYSLVFNIFYNNKLEISSKGFLTPLDNNSKNLLSLFVCGKIEYRHIAHVIGILASNYFQGHYECTLSPIEQAVLLLLGIQHKKFDEIHTFLEMEEYKTTVKLLSLVSKLLSVS